MIHTFYKDNTGWFIDLPEYINSGLGTKANLAMVLGADTFLDKLSDNGNRITLEISETPIDDSDGVLDIMGFDSPEEDLIEVGHPIEVGAYYMDFRTHHQMWLCPVTKYVFYGEYPHKIFYKKIN
jgi:hypothetical protein